MEKSDIFAGFQTKLLNEIESQVNDLCSTPIETVEFDCWDLRHVRICAHYIPEEAEYCEESVEELEVNTPKFAQAYIFHVQCKSLYFQRCEKYNCSHDNLNVCRIIARYHQANVVLMDHMRSCAEDGLNFAKVTRINRPSFTEMNSFQYFCYHSIH